ncbi:uncharacterized protein LOC115257830 [Aedes albopictus]|uniref:Uncharacterized protein n=1 Tax=Aedes albopictus TaxID=7160 RepID=A0ABM1Z805_AEDAL
MYYTNIFLLALSALPTNCFKEVFSDSSNPNIFSKNFNSCSEPHKMSRQAPLDDTYCVCELCQMSPSIDRGMVACDTCEKWFHYSCANVDDSIQDQPWCCKLCLAMRSQRQRQKGTSTVSSRRKKAKELELKRLDEEYDVMASFLDESDDDEEESVQGSKVSNVSRTRQWIDKQIEVKGGPKPFETYNLQAIPEAGPSYGVLQGANFPVTPAGRPDSRVLTRHPPIPQAAVAHDNGRQQAHLVPSLPEFQPQESTVNSYGLGMVSSLARSQGPSNDRDHRASLVEPLGVPILRNAAVSRVENPFNANVGRNDRQQQSVSAPPSMFGEFPVCGPSPAQIAARQVWPKKLPTFSGVIEEWPIFISSYENSNAACGFSDVENLIRLQESLKGPALETVRSRLVLPANVPRVVDTLRRIYGKPEVLIRSLISKVRGIDPPKQDRLDTVIKFGMAVQQLCDHLEAANQQDHLSNPVLLQEMVDKLPANFKLEWVRFKKIVPHVSIRTFGDFMEQLMEEASEVTFVNPTAETSAKQERRSAKEKGFVHAHSDAAVASIDDKLRKLTIQVSEDKPCAICSKVGHRARNCEEFRRLTVGERLRLVADRNLCALCLYGHGAMRCRNKLQCNVSGCGAKHHPLLHRVEKGPETNCMLHHRRSKCSVIFRVIPVTLKNGTEQFRTYAFFDEGSSRTLLEKGVAAKLGLKGAIRPLNLTWTSGVTRTEKSSMSVKLTISGKEQLENYPLNEVHTVDRLNLPQQTVEFHELVEKFTHLRDIDIENQTNAQPTILIGLDNMDLMAPIESRIGKEGEPIGLRCKLGWTISGPTSAVEADGYCGVHQCDVAMDQVLRNYFTMEEAGVNCPYRVESDEDRRARRILEQTTVRIGQCFETGLLWRTDDVSMPDSYPMAYRRLQGLERRFAKEPGLQDKVTGAIEEFVTKGYAHKATSSEVEDVEPGKTWYLPLNVVVNPKKPGKIRLTLDAAAKAGGVSLNDVLIKGPDMLASLPVILNHFRARRIGFGGDIREMFLQIRMREQDKQFQRFLFRRNTSCVPDVYIMDAVIFGAKCSPCNAHFTKDTNALEHASRFPDAADAIIKRHYVDDYFDSADDEDEAIERALAVRHVHSLGGFEIRNWLSNSPKVLDALGDHEGVAKTLCYDKALGSERVLGLLWRPDEDVFSFNMGLMARLNPYLIDGVRPTKRILLKCVMSFFDPIGFLSPLLIHGKIIIQETWRSNTEWDQPVTDEIFRRWLDWTKMLPSVEAVKIPRCFFGNESIDNVNDIQLHIFSDAGDDAYGCVAYLRYTVGADVRCSLIGSKSKVAPLQLTSTPRLELQAAVIGARMLNTLCSSLCVPIRERFLWVDSMTVLSWIRSDSRKYKPYVAHRVAEILHTTNVADWRYVPSKKNVADDLTKWGSGTTLDVESRWFKGPSFLFDGMESWPEQPGTKPLVPEELRTCYLLHHIVLPEPIIDVNRISKWTVLLRSVALVFRFISNCRRRVKKLPIEAIGRAEGRPSTIAAVWVAIQQEELDKAQRVLWRMAQSDSFADEIKVLLKNKELPPGEWFRIERSSRLCKTSPFIDQDGVVRMEGRTAAAEFAAIGTRFPVILPREHPITKKIVEDFHVRYGHASKETMVNEVRQMYFIPKLRAMVGKVINGCLVCRLRKSKPVMPRMAPLPVQRMQPFIKAFSYVGLDYFGPIDVSVGRRTEKRYVALFTCLVVRAVHCEVAFSLSTESCKLAIRRFIRRRGSPVEILSDNGTNFKGASRELIEELKKIDLDCADTFTDAKTKWTFNPPSAPHMGGVWERMVRSVKEAMAVLNDGRKLNDEILMTTLTEAEYLINSRPLLYAGTEDTELDAITPNHFLCGSSSGRHEPFRTPISLAEELKSSYKRSQALAKELWNRWCKEYFPTLNQRSKWYEESRTLEVGDLVLVMDTKDGTGVRGVVQEVFAGLDGRVRQAMVRTNTGCFRRPVSKLAVLEIDDKPGEVSGEGQDQGLWAGECSNHCETTVSNPSFKW